jgi:integrase
MSSVFKRKQDKGKKGSRYIASWRDEFGVWKHKTACTDRESSLAMAQRLAHESNLRREGFTSNIRDESIKAIDEQLRAYIIHVTSEGNDAKYISNLHARISRVIAATKAKRLLDIEPGKVQAAILAMPTKRGLQKEGKPIALSTRNEYINSMKCFTKWAKAVHKLEHDPLTCLSQAEESEEDKEHPRRALSMTEITKLLNAALTRPEADLLTIRTGKNKGQRGAKVRPSILAKARKTGIDRRMAYLLAIWTGLRRKELSQLEWRDVFLDIPHPCIHLRARTTKSGRADAVPLHSQMSEELQRYRPSNASPRSRVIPGVPSIKVLQGDLAFAGIEYGNKEMGFADLHAQRMTLNMMLAGQGIGLRTRQAQLRHTDASLTEITYFDKCNFLKPQAEMLNTAAPIPTTSPSPARPKPLTEPASASQLVHKTCGPRGHLGSQIGTYGESGSEVVPTPTPAENHQNSPENVATRHDPASSDTGSKKKRAKGIEPSTCTLGTCRSTTELRPHGGLL